MTDLSIGGSKGDYSIINTLPGVNTIVTINDFADGAFAATERNIDFGQAGNDRISVASKITQRMWLHGIDGNDMLTDSPSMIDKLHGVLGRDWFWRFTGDVVDDLYYRGDGFGELNSLGSPVCESPALSCLFTPGMETYASFPSGKICVSSSQANTVLRGRSGSTPIST